MSSATKGGERELFVTQALSNVIAPPFRVGTGDITDSTGVRSGQVDVVIEYGSSISFPLSAAGARLYLAEGVCAVIEVKSNLASQWNEVLESHQKLAPLRKAYGMTVGIGRPPSIKIPHFAVGFQGWKTTETVVEKFQESDLDGILVIDSANYVGRNCCATGPWSLLGLFIEISTITSAVFGSSPDYPAYAK